MFQNRLNILIIVIVFTLFSSYSFSSPNPIQFNLQPPSYEIPNGCNTPIVREAIHIVETKGAEYLKADSTIAKPGWMTYTPGVKFNGMSDDPIIWGIFTIDEYSELAAHYHDFYECYYIVSGKARTWINGAYVDMKPKHWYEIPANGIHQTMNYGPEPFFLFYWFPNHAKFLDYVAKLYYFEHNTTDEEALPLFKEIHTNQEYMAFKLAEKAFREKSE
jgi:mannose-6-phosphate isomerase-like protein (cupin superfamily)